MSDLPKAESTRRNRVSLSIKEQAELRARKREAQEILQGRCSATMRTECLVRLERIRVLELAHEGLRDSKIARRLDRHPEHVRRVVARYLKRGLGSLLEGRGRPVDQLVHVEILATIDLIREQHAPVTPADYARFLNLYWTASCSLPTVRRYLRAAGLRFRVRRSL